MMELRNQQVLVVHREAGTSFHIRFGKASKGGKLPTSGSYLSSQKEGRQTSPIYDRSSVPSPRRCVYQQESSRVLLVAARSQESRATSKVTSGIRKDKKAVAPRQARQVGRWECSDFGIPVLIMEGQAMSFSAGGIKVSTWRRLFPIPGAPGRSLCHCSCGVTAEAEPGIFLEEMGLEQRTRGGWYRDEAFPWTMEAHLPYSRAWEVRQLSLFLSSNLGEER